ncbi:MAG: hypothetical protein GY854_33415 [Deltaproteobacteria bacterium]|nr:hypothetical protein [Deltaproteobacteria bacterium]
MKTKMFKSVVGFIVACSMLGCGGSQPESNTEKLLDGEDENVDLYSHLTGIDDNTAVADDDEDEEQPEEAAAEAPADATEEIIEGNQGAFLGTLVIAGKPIKGSYTVKSATASGEVVKKNVPSGKEIRLDPGMYDFVFTSPEITGNPELTLRDVEIPSGRRIKRDVKFPVGKITLVTGARCAKKPIRIKQKGATDWIKGKFYTCVEMTLQAGEYEAEVGGKKRGTPISGIQVYDGGIRDILIRNK